MVGGFIVIDIDDFKKTCEILEREGFIWGKEIIINLRKIKTLDEIEKIRNVRGEEIE